MTKQRKNYGAEFKAKVAIAAIKGDQTGNQIASTYGVHPNQVTPWKKQALGIIPDAFSSRQARQADEEELLKARLYQEIGQLKVELDWLKKKLDLTVAEQRQLIERDKADLSLARQAEVVP